MSNVKIGNRGGGGGVSGGTFGQFSEKRKIGSMEVHLTPGQVKDLVRAEEEGKMRRINRIRQEVADQERLNPLFPVEEVAVTEAEKSQETAVRPVPTPKTFEKIVEEKASNGKIHGIWVAEILRKDPEVGEGRHKVFSREDFAKRIVTVQSSFGSRDDTKRYTELFSRMVDSGVTGVQPLILPDIDAVNEVGITCPNFKAVTSYIVDRITLAKAGLVEFRFPPLLLVGPPGTGKSHFASKLAVAMGVASRHINFDQPVVGAVICGSDKHWSNSTHGQVADALMFGGCGNPMIVIDEIDKAGRRDYADPVMPLLSALEPVSSKSFNDISLDMRFDASRVMWMFLANELGPIPAPILSRMTVFKVAIPTGAAKLVLAREVIQNAFTEIGVKGFREPSNEVVKYLGQFDARTIYKAAQDGVIKACKEMRRSLLLADVKVHQEPVEEVRKEAL